jgi:hypothetical protein
MKTFLFAFSLLLSSSYNTNIVSRVDAKVYLCDSKSAVAYHISETIAVV